MRVLKIFTRVLKRFTRVLILFTHLSKLTRILLQFKHILFQLMCILFQLTRFIATHRILCIVKLQILFHTSQIATNLMLCLTKKMHKLHISFCGFKIQGCGTFAVNGPIPVKLQNTKHFGTVLSGQSLARVLTNQGMEGRRS